MLGQHLAGLPAQSLNAVEHAGRQPCLMCDFRKQHGRVGRPFSRLVHNSAAGCQGRRNFPCRQHKRRVPGSDNTDRADGLALREIDVPLRWERQSIPGTWRLSAKNGSSPRPDRGLGHELDGLPGIPAFNQRDFLRMDSIASATCAGFDGALCQKLPSIRRMHSQPPGTRCRYLRRFPRKQTR